MSHCCMYMHVVSDSPSSACLRSHDEVRQYLLKEGTCKCGLQCPLLVEKTFVFDSQRKQSKHLSADDIQAISDRSNSLCNHRRKIIAMATFQQSTGFQFTKHDTTSSLCLPVSLPRTTESIGKWWPGFFADLHWNAVVEDLHFKYKWHVTFCISVRCAVLSDLPKWILLKWITRLNWYYLSRLDAV